MIPNYYGMLPHSAYQVCNSASLNSPFLPFSYPCFFPFPFNPYTEGYSPLQPHEQNSQKQILIRHDPKVVPLEKPSDKQQVKKKSSKSECRQGQSQKGTKKQLNWSADFGEQKEGRNANSNLLRMFFRRLEFKIENDSEKLIKIWKKFGFNISIDEFAQWVRQAKVDYRNYIRVPSVKRLFVPGSKLREHGKILRVLLKYFLESESICCYLTSRKIKKQSMPHNFTSIRSISHELFHQSK